MDKVLNYKKFSSWIFDLDDTLAYCVKDRNEKADVYVDMELSN